MFLFGALFFLPNNVFDHFFHLHIKCVWNKTIFITVMLYLDMFSLFRKLFKQMLPSVHPEFSKHVEKFLIAIPLCQPDTLKPEISSREITKLLKKNG